MRKTIEMLKKLVGLKEERGKVAAREEALQEEIDRLLTRVQEATREQRTLRDRERVLDDEIATIEGFLSLMEEK